MATTYPPEATHHTFKLSMETAQELQLQTRGLSQILTTPINIYYILIYFAILENREVGGREVGFTIKILLQTSFPNPLSWGVRFNQGQSTLHEKPRIICMHVLLIYIYCFNKNLMKHVRFSFQAHIPYLTAEKLDRWYNYNLYYAKCYEG